MGCSNKIMDIGMPAMSTYFAFIVPSAIGIYWMFRSVLSTVKQIIMSKAMPLPRFTEEDYKEAEREIMGKGGGKRRTARVENKSGERPESMHNDGDDDAEEYAAAVKRSLESECELSKKSPYYDGPDADETDEDIETSAEDSDSEQASDDKNGMIEKMPLKEDKNVKSEKKKKKKK